MRELERIDPKYYDILNDYIRVGKRLLPQRKRIENPLYKKRNELFNKFTESLLKYKSESFSIKAEKGVITYTSLYIKCKPKRWCSTGFGSYLRIDKANTFKDMFADMIDRLSDSKWCAGIESKDNPASKILKELYDFIEKIKQENILLFFEYIRTRDKYNRVVKLISRKLNAQNERYKELEKMWNHDNPPMPGLTVKYKTADGKEKREGIIKGISEDSKVYIKTPGNKTISRNIKDVTWPNCFRNTVLRACIFDLWSGVPIIWKENRVDFYR